MENLSNGTLDGLGSTIRMPKRYKINMDEINDIQDIKNILESLNLTFWEHHWLNNIPEKYKTEVVDK